MSKFKVGDVVVANSNCPKISKQQGELKAGYNGWTEQYKAFLEGTFGVVKAFYGGDEGYEIGVSGFSSTFQTGEYYDSIKLYERTAQKPDAVNSPKHYSVFEKLEAIEVIASSMTADQFYGYCLGNILKYRLRAGGKDDVMQELGKADKYQELFTKYKHLCKGVR